MKRQLSMSVETTDSGLQVTQSRIEIGDIADCIDQVHETYGKRSCFVTSVLNGLVMRETVSRDQAQAAQERLVSDTNYSECWTAQGSHVVWNNNTDATRRALSDVLGTEVALREAPADELGAALRDGSTVVIADTHHARLAFQPKEGTVGVHDPYNATISGEYELDRASGFHLPARNIVIV